MPAGRNSTTSAENSWQDDGGRLAGKTAVVTGGARGIGAQIASRFEREGATTYVIDVNSGPGERWLRADVSDETAIEDAMEKIVGESGRLDICVANAGISPTITHVTDLDLETWRSVIDVNLTGVFLTLRAAGRRMVRAGRGGRLIATGSVGSFAGMAGGAAYSSAKFGLRGLIQSMALELAPSVTVESSRARRLGFGHEHPSPRDDRPDKRRKRRRRTGGDGGPNSGGPPRLPCGGRRCICLPRFRRGCVRDGVRTAHRRRLAARKIAMPSRVFGAPLAAPLKIRCSSEL